MEITNYTFRLMASSVAGLLLSLGACSADATITEPEPPDVLSGADLPEILSTAIQDEFHAEEVYRGVLADFGAVLPFANIMEAEVRHSTAIAALFEARGWLVPENEWTSRTVPHFETVAAACEVGVDGEIANVAVYDVLLQESGLPADVVRVFESNRRASLEKHLPAFQRCAGG